MKVNKEQLMEGFKEAGHISRADVINNPMHYTVGGYESIDVIKAKLSPDEYRGYCKGNILKYLMRANYKEHHDLDIQKAHYYMKELDDALEIREVNSEDPPF